MNRFDAVNTKSLIYDIKHNLRCKMSDHRELLITYILSKQVIHFDMLDNLCFSIESTKKVLTLEY